MLTTGDIVYGDNGTREEISLSIGPTGSTTSNQRLHLLALPPSHIFPLHQVLFLFELRAVSFGTVYKGYIDENVRVGLKSLPVSVKVLNKEGLQGHREWLTEVNFLGQPRHPNLVKLIGYCCEDDHRLLVYELHTSNMQDPVGGTISRNENGEPSGLMIDSAMKVVLSCIPEVSVEERRQALDRANVYKWADLSGRMMIRVCLFFPMPTWSRLLDIIQKTGRRLSQWIFLGGVKAFSDGSLGSNSALFHKPYVDEPWNIGLQVTDMESLSNMTVQSDKYGLQVAINAIGDKANDLILDRYKSIVSTFESWKCSPVW
ncbi:unnamed protein product [Lactuca virosa]|uniref:Protein kinase domain-containing protein n=1 Tax=Lactuca virosa TaxID=75947 RepID=A0AAU9MNL8_9ASTR|nr:unnamed protein product [Lactuca virosa]